MALAGEAYMKEIYEEKVKEIEKELSKVAKPYLMSGSYDMTSHP